MSQFIDRRLNSRHKSAVNRQRFIRRFKGQIKKAISGVIAKRSITDIENGEKITIPTRDTNEPTIAHGEGGVHEQVHPGNKEFVSGDKIKRPPSGGAGDGGANASNQGEGEDNFVFELSREEFLDLFFDDLALPHLIKKELVELALPQPVHAGISISGTPTNINILRSMRIAKSRHIAMASPLHKKIKDAEKELATCLAQHPIDTELKATLLEKLEKLKSRLTKIPFLDPYDLRYNMRTTEFKPTTQAVMICIMDVSGSMDESKKDIAKRFFILLHLFLVKNYDRIELVFIRHHTTAKEVNEQDFFYSRETGGTVVSSALELTRDVIQKRYPPSQWNIYVAQASDGDNWNADSPYCREILARDILPFVQYFAYVEIMARHHQSLWEEYAQIVQPNFAMQSIAGPQDIYPVLRDLFKKESA